MGRPANPNPPHGSQARYKGTKNRPPCRCRRCVKGWTQAGQRRHLLRLAGKPASLTPDEIARVVAHIRVCQDAGMSQNVIARKADIAQSTISRLLNRPQAGCLRAQGERILAVRVGDFDDRSDRPSTGTVRRVRSLYLAGHGPLSISAVTSLSEAMVTELAGGRYPCVSARTEAAVRRAVTVLAGRAGTCRAARRRAEREGWAPLGAWDAIDDPNCTPDTVEGEPSFLERAAIRREEIIHLAWCGHEPEQILDRLNGEVSISTVRQIVQEWRTGQKRVRTNPERTAA
jgi:transposase